MKVPKKTAFLAYVESLVLTDPDGEVVRLSWGHDESGLFCNGAQTNLFILPLRTRKKIEPPRGAAAQKKAFESFTAWESNDAIELSIPDNRTRLAVFGWAIEIRYQSDKWTGRKQLYSHEYRSPVGVYSDRPTARGSKVWGLRAKTGARLVSERGLIR